MQNLVNFFCPIDSSSEITRIGKLETFQTAVEKEMKELEAVSQDTQVLVFRSVDGTMGATRIMVLCTNNATANGFFIFHAVEAALEKVYPELYKEKRFVVFMYPKQ